MKASFQELYGEQTSPLFRIMAVYDIAHPQFRRFENNVCAFHIGRGYFLSVSHNLLTHNNIPRSLVTSHFQAILATGDAQQRQFIQKRFQLEPTTGTMRWNENNKDVQQLVSIFSQIGYDSRYPQLYNDAVCTPYVLMQFRTAGFFGDTSLNARFTNGRYFFEAPINRHTYLLDLKLCSVLVGPDISIYRLATEYLDLADMIPFRTIDYEIHDVGDNSLYCLQSAPVNELGRLLNKASIEGLIDHFSTQGMIRNTNCIHEGDRYLIKGYFRFGSSGAPYLHYEPEADEFMFNAIQSEACPLQLLIQGNRDNNAQYVNAIATPLCAVRADLEALP